MLRRAHWASAQGGQCRRRASQASEALTKRNGSTPIILIDPGKDAEVDFSDVSQARTGNWRLRFDNRGRLTKAELENAGPLKTRVVPMAPIIPPIEPE